MLKPKRLSWQPGLLLTVRLAAIGPDAHPSWEAPLLSWPPRLAAALKVESEDRLVPRLLASPLLSGFVSRVTKLPTLGCGQSGSWAPAKRMLVGQPEQGRYLGQLGDCVSIHCWHVHVALPGADSLQHTTGAQHQLWGHKGEAMAQAPSLISRSPLDLKSESICFFGSLGANKY